jgi:hypothetical protein
MVKIRVFIRKMIWNGGTELCWGHDRAQYQLFVAGKLKVYRSLKNFQLAKVNRDFPTGPGTKVYL